MTLEDFLKVAQAPFIMIIHSSTNKPLFIINRPGIIITRYLYGGHKGEIKFGSAPDEFHILDKKNLDPSLLKATVETISYQEVNGDDLVVQEGKIKGLKVKVFTPQI